MSKTLILYLQKSVSLSTVDNFFESYEPWNVQISKKIFDSQDSQDSEMRGETFCSLLVAHYFLLVARYFLLVARYFFARCSLLFVRCSLLFARCSLLFARYLLRFARCSLRFARCSLLFAHCSLLFARCSLLFNPCSTRNFEGYFWVKINKTVLHINL